MLTSRRLSRVLSRAVFLSALLLAAVGVATALAGPTVTVRVEGLTQTLLPPTEVTTTTAPVIKDGEHACSGTSAAGALQLATSGNWNGAWFSGLGYSVEMLEGQSYPFTQPYYWSFWLDNKPASSGICGAELNPGDSILFFPECFSVTIGVCPASPPNPLGVEVPAVAEVGRQVMVTVTSYANATGTPSPAFGATVAAEGVSGKTDSTGRATLCFSSTGVTTLRVTAPESIRTEAIIRVQAGNGGTCGTPAPPTSSSVTSGSGATPEGGVKSVSNARPHALVARVTGLLEGHVYRRRSAPRLLQGTVEPHATLRDVELRLTRRQRSKCAFYDGLIERFRAMRCGAVHGSFFSVGDHAHFSYLLPAALAPGRYVLDIEATDAMGNRTTLARRTSRIVFYVR